MPPISWECVTVKPISWECVTVKRAGELSLQKTVVLGGGFPPVGFLAPLK